MMNEHFIVHFTVINPLPVSTYGTSVPSNRALAIVDANAKAKQGRLVYITQRNSKGDIVETIRDWDGRPEPRNHFDKPTVAAWAGVSVQDIGMEDDSYTIDGMVWWQWLEAMTMQ